MEKFKKRSIYIIYLYFKDLLDQKFIEKVESIQFNELLFYIYIYIYRLLSLWVKLAIANKLTH